MVRGCTAGPCPEQAEGTRTHEAEPETVTAAPHLTTAVTAREVRYKDRDLPPSAVPIVPQEQTKTVGGEEDTTEMYVLQYRCFLPAAGLG